MPLFIPHGGCRGHCLFCDQGAQTGQYATSYDNTLLFLKKALEDLKKTKRPPLELGFYGGTFTALPAPWPDRFTEVANHYKTQGILSSIRCSTRPDAVSEAQLRRLAAQGMDRVELGIQSFDTDVLKACARGYDRRTATSACTLVRRCGLELGVHLMPGLPGATATSFRRDIATLLDLDVQTVRLHPTVVLKKTGLARLHTSGRYTPLSLNQAIEQLAEALLPLWKANIHVIRMGVAREEGFLDNIVAGPWHDALGQRAASLALFHFLRQRLLQLETPARRLEKLCVPRRFESDTKGWKNENIPRFKALGIDMDRIAFWDRTFFLLRPK